MLQVLKLQRSVVATKEYFEGVKNVVKDFGSSSNKQLKNWSRHLEGSLKMLAVYCERMSSTLGNVTEQDNQMFNNLETNFDLVALKKEAGKVRAILSSEYAKTVDTLKTALSNATNLDETLVELIKENVEKLIKTFNEIANGHPGMIAGILSHLKTLHSNVISDVAKMQEWRLTRQTKRKVLPENLLKEFEKNLKSAGTKCLVALQETSKCVKKLDIVEDDENSGFLVTSFDRAVSGLKSLKVASVLSDFEALSGFVDLCEQSNFDVSPLLSQVKMFSTLIEVYIDYVDRLCYHCELMGVITCRYLSQCSHVLRAFLLYDFGKTEQEDGKEGEYSYE